VTLRFRGLAALGLAAGLCRLAPAAEPAAPAPLPAVAPSPSQQLATTVAEQLRATAQLRHYAVDVSVRAGVVELTGSVADQAQREEVLRVVQGVPGVERVVDHLVVAASSARPVAAEAPAQTAPAPTRLPDALPNRGGGNGDGQTLPEPRPLTQGPPVGPYDLAPPRLPPYAWPTYAPYNNFSRVAYPLAYPYNSWPFIGPVYPFPKVPLGWRAVKLEWQDGYWWFSRVGHPYDWWRMRYW
jgi:hypothetical protein